MEILRSIDGFIDISNFKKLYGNFYQNNDKIYYFKEVDNSNMIYNELIAEEIAYDYKIPCAHYDLAILNGNKGVISECFIPKNGKFFKMKEVLESCFENIELDNKRNNLQDIWYALEFRYKNINIVKKIMNQVVNMFMFDTLIGNMDRHYLNYGIIEEDGDINISPLFDNERMLTYCSIYFGGYSLGIDKNDCFLNGLNLEYDDNYLLKFLSVSASEYKDYYMSKLWIISDENIDRIFKRVENRTNTKIDNDIKNDMKKKFKINRNMIEGILKTFENKKLN